MGGRKIVTRRGGGLSDETFDSAGSAARWCGEAGLAKAERDYGITSMVPGRRKGAGCP